MIPLASVVMAGCLAVNSGSDHITIRDLAPAFPGMEIGLPDTPVALAPTPGFQRMFRLPELRRLASRLNITAVPEKELCFERRVTPLDPERLLSVMQKEMPDARIEILEYSRLSAPEGELEFPVLGLRQIPSGGLWSGSVRYGGNRRFVIWAKVKVLVTAPCVIAVEDLKAGRVVEISKLRVERREVFPSGSVFPTALEQVAGRVLLHPASAGMVLRSQWLEPAKEVARGETVQVDVWSGGAHLKLPAVAEASGSIGQTILVRSTESTKPFRARVVGKGKVSVGEESQ